MVKKTFIVLLALAAAVSGPLSCGSAGSPDDQGDNGDSDLSAPAQVITRAEDAARQTEERAQQQEDQINQQLDQLP